MHGIKKRICHVMYFPISRLDTIFQNCFEVNLGFAREKFEVLFQISHFTAGIITVCRELCVTGWPGSRAVQSE